MKLIVPKRRIIIPERPRLPLRRPLPDARFPRIEFPRIIKPKMVAAYVNSASNANGGSTTTITISGFNSDNSGAATNTAALFVVATGPGSSPAATPFTWNGVSTGISQVGSTLTVPTTSVCWVYGLIGITGTHSAVATWVTSNFGAFAIMTFSGVNQTSVAAAFTNFGSRAQNPGATTNAVTLSGSVNDIFAIFGEDDGSTNISSITNGTTRLSPANNSTGNNIIGCTAAGAASTTFTLNLAASDDSGILGCDVVSAGAAAVVPDGWECQGAQDITRQRILATGGSPT